MATPGGASRLRVRVLSSVLLATAILLLPALLYAWGRQADAFTIERVTVTGGRRVPEKEALRVLRKEFVGDNLFTVTTADVRATLQRFAYLASVEVDRDFPTTLRVRLREHRPGAYVMADGRWFEVADSGHVIRELGGEDSAARATAADTGPEDGVPVDGVPAGGSGAATMNGVPGQGGAPTPDPTSSTAPEAGTAGAAAEAEAAADANDAAVAAALLEGPPDMRQPLPRIASVSVPRVGRAVGDTRVRIGLRVLAGLPLAVRSRVLAVRVGVAGQVTLHVDRGLLVELGDDQRLVAKALALRAVLTAYRRAGTDPTYIDVSAPDRPLGRPRLTS